MSAHTKASLIGVGLGLAAMAGCSAILGIPDAIEGAGGASASSTSQGSSGMGGGPGGVGVTVSNSTSTNSTTSSSVSSGAGGAGGSVSPCGDHEWAHWNPEKPTTYTTTADTVADSTTGLTWQRVVDPNSYTWQQATSYCDGLAPMGYWRLPTRIELTSIVAFAKSSPAIDLTAFPGTPGEVFWSSSSYAKLSNQAWHVDFNDGLSSGDDVFVTARVRCVH